uniref:type I restriction-modification system subunit M n=1 Tax=Anaerobiospirillum succiniciproducens TaxID=13335 RepID=UPI00248E5EBB
DWDDNPVDFSVEVNFIWTIANRLRGAYRADKYKDVIIPMTILRRFECALEGTKAKVLAEHKSTPNMPAKMLQRISGYSFYNISPFTLTSLLDDPDHISANFKAYIEGFSDNVQDIINKLGFIKQIDKMEETNRLYSVVQGFASLDLDPAHVDNIKMGYIFEDLIRRFSENEEAGDHYTGRDIIKTMVSILLAEGSDDVFQPNKVITVLDQAAGTGGMLSTCYNYIRRFNPTADVRLFGQEVNDESYAICLAEMLIKGQSADNIRYQDTFKADCFPGQKMRYVLENPPFGTPWGGKDAPDGAEDAVRAEFAKGENGRWGAGLPGTGDAQLLFIQSAVNKMDDKMGRAAIVENGSPLFSGGTSSGESQIRRWLLENDLIEAIIALPTDMFYNTDIATYIWVLSKNKRKERQGKVQLIDATTLCTKLLKSLGKKRNEIDAENRKRITELYANFEENEYSKIFPNKEFMYREYTVKQPLQLNYAITEDRIINMISTKPIKKFYDEAKRYALENSDELSTQDKAKLEKLISNEASYTAILNALRANLSDVVYKNKKLFKPVITKALEDCKVSAKLLDSIMHGLSVMDKTADIQYDGKKQIIYDKESADTEIVKIDESIDEYMAREVLPHVPDAKAFFEEDLTEDPPKYKTGAEINFTRYFYKYQQPEKSSILAQRFIDLETSVSARIASLFKGD